MTKDPTMTKTLADLTGATGLPVDPHLVQDLVIPVIDGIQAQGDLLVVPHVEVADQVRVHATATWLEVPPDGVELVRGAVGGNVHSLVADPGTAVWTTDVDDATGLALGVVEAMTPVYLLHREHGGTGIAPGRYVVRRQREQAPPAVRGEQVPPGQHRQTPRGLQAARENAQRYRYVAD
jgi:hypothetical protein